MSVPQTDHAYQYFLIRLAPNPLRDEFVNVGVALYGGEGEFADVRVLADWMRVRRLWPGFDPSDLDQLEEGLRTELRDMGRRQALLYAAEETFSLALRFSPPAGLITSDPQAELDALFHRYVDAPAPVQAREPGERERLLQHLQSVFAQANILARLGQRVQLRELVPEAPRDSFRFDFHYRPNGAHHLLHAVPLGSEEARVKTVCFTAQQWREQLGPDRFDCTAVVNDETGESEWDYHAELLRGSGLHIRSWREAPQLAGEIRTALHLS